MKKSLILLLVGAILVTFCLASAVKAGIPHLINYQGMLTDNSGTPLSGSYNLTFKIYDDTTTGTLKWSETQSGVSVLNGLFNVVLGKVSALNLAFDQSYWLEVGVGAETMPRIRFTSVGYAYRALVADSAKFTPPPSTGGGWTDDGAVVRLNNSSDNIGIGTSSPASKLHVNGAITVNQNPLGSCLIMADNSAVVRWQQYVHPSDQSLRFWQGGVGDKVTITAPGKVGIGTNEPSQQLHVVGPLRWQNVNGGVIGELNFDTGADLIGIGSTVGGAGAASLSLWAGGTERIRIDQSGNVGIGLNSPDHKLHVNGAIMVNQNPLGSCLIMADNSSVVRWQQYVNPSDQSLRFWQGGGGGDKITITQSGNVGIGTTTPSTKLAVYGLNSTSSYNYVKVNTATGNFYYQSSSKRFKEDVQPLEDDFHRILQVKPKSFVDKVSRQREIGYIAEEFDGVGLNDLVIYDKERQPDGLKYELVSLYLLEVMKDQIAAIKNLKLENQCLRQRIEALEGKVTK